MVTTLENLAQARMFDSEKFTTFMNEQAMALVNDDGTISSWFINDACEAYIRHIGFEELDAYRRNLIESRYNNVISN